MADLAFGISKTALQLLADKVKNAIKEEAVQWQTVQSDLVFITGEFEMMQSFLDTVTEEHVKNKILRTWVRQVRELSNDVEDNIDFVLHLDTKKRSCWLRLVPSCCMTGGPLPVDQAVAETALLKARVLDVSQRNIRYNQLIVDSASKPMAGMDLVPVQKTATGSLILINAVEKSSVFNLHALISREDRDLQVVSFCETGGDLVQVAFVRKAYNDSSICNEFAYRAWVKLMHPFNPIEFIQNLMTQFLAHSCQEQVNIGPDGPERVLWATQESIIKEFTHKENNHKYLIVLEDLSTLAQWDAIRSFLPDKKKGSRIVVLTHHPVVASQCTGEPCRVSELNQFSPAHYVRVYYKETFRPDRVPSFISKKPNNSLSDFKLLGRRTEMHELLEMTENTKKSRLISVWGMHGVGKSSLVEAIYRELLRTSTKFHRHAWVSVSHPFNPTEFCQNLLVDLQGESSSSAGYYNANALRAQDPIKECQDQICQRVCLFVIDDVQSNEDWDWIKSNLIQHGDSGSCIITITSEESLAKHCAVSYIDGVVYNVKGLHTTPAGQAFKKAIGGNGCYLEDDHQVKQEAELLVSKCGGLPKVLITMAKYLSNKARDVFIQEMRRLNDNLMMELLTNTEFESLRGLLAWMHAYLDACPRHLKKCMLYLSIFPQDITIRRRRLIRRWIAEGYSKGTDSTSMEKYAEKMFDEVAALCIMQPVLDASKVIGYRVNSFFREYIMSRPAEERICLPVEVSVLEKQGHGCLRTEGIGQHLAIGGTWDEDNFLFDSLDFTRLRSLTVLDRRFSSFYVSDRMRVLRVLDLEDAEPIEEDTLQGIGKLPSRLKFLSLRGQESICHLPDSVGDLLQLQTLDIRKTSIATLPPFITKLNKLQYIRAGSTVAWMQKDDRSMRPSSTRSSTLLSCLPNKSIRRAGCSSFGVELPRGINRLEALQTLSAVDVNTADGKTILDEIVLYLPRLKKLEVCGMNPKNGPRSLNGLLQRKPYLESLSLQFEMNTRRSDRFNVVITNDWTSLRSLKILGDVQHLPMGIKDVVSLRKLTLEMTQALFTAEVIQQLGSLPSLLTLRLRVNASHDLGELRFPRALFSKLQVLEIACIAKSFMFEEATMEKLEQLKLHGRAMSEMQISGIEQSEMKISGLERLASLKQVWLLGPCKKELEKAVQQQLDKHPKIPAPKLEVQPHSS